MSSRFAQLLEDVAQEMGIEDINDPKVVAAAQEKIEAMMDAVYERERENKVKMPLDVTFGKSLAPRK